MCGYENLIEHMWPVCFSWPQGHCVNLASMKLTSMIVAWDSMTVSVGDIKILSLSVAVITRLFSLFSWLSLPSLQGSLPLPSTDQLTWHCGRPCWWLLSASENQECSDSAAYDFSVQKDLFSKQYIESFMQTSQLPARLQWYFPILGYVSTLTESSSDFNSSWLDHISGII